MLRKPLDLEVVCNTAKANHYFFLKLSDITGNNMIAHQ